VRRVFHLLVVVIVLIMLSGCAGDSKKGAYEYALQQAAEAFAKPLGPGMKSAEKYSADKVDVYKEEGSNIYSTQFRITLNNGKEKTVYVKYIRLDEKEDKWTYGGMTWWD